MSRFMLIGAIAVLASSPAFALNETAGNSAAVPPPAYAGPAVTDPSIGGPSAGSPCYKAKARLSPEEKARRKAMKAERAAQGLPTRSGARRAKPVC